MAHRLLRFALRLASLPLIALLHGLLRMVLPQRKIRIVVLDPRLFGHQSLEPEVFWNDWQTDIERGSRDVWFCCLGKKSNASNSLLWHHTKEKFPTLPSWFVTSVAYWKRRFSFTQLELMEASIYRLQFLTSRLTTLPQAATMTERRREILSRLDNPERPYVVFTVREFNPLSSDNELRNRQISAFVPAMEALGERGFNVVRLTSRTNDVLQSGLKNVLDWQVLEQGIPGDELAIISGASFVVTTTTGGDCLALAYRRPVLYIDSARFFLVFLGTELATFQMPRFEDIEKGESLKLEQILQRGLGWVGEQSAFVKAGVRVINSSPMEIRDHVVEYHATGDWHHCTAEDALERTWREMLLIRHGDVVAKRHGPIRARMHPASKRSLM
jgi:putative glycosyltransferase (TIGR04372 family)